MELVWLEQEISLQILESLSVMNTKVTGCKNGFSFGEKSKTKKTAQTNIRHKQIVIKLIITISHLRKTTWTNFLCWKNFRGLPPLLLKIDFQICVSMADTCRQVAINIILSSSVVSGQIIYML